MLMSPVSSALPSEKRPNVSDPLSAIKVPAVVSVVAASRKLVMLVLDAEKPTKTLWLTAKVPKGSFVIPPPKTAVLLKLGKIPIPGEFCHEAITPLLSELVVALPHPNKNRSLVSLKSEPIVTACEGDPAVN